MPSFILGKYNFFGNEQIVDFFTLCLVKRLSCIFLNTISLSLPFGIYTMTCLNLIISSCNQIFLTFLPPYVSQIFLSDWILHICLLYLPSQISFTHIQNNYVKFGCYLVCVHLSNLACLAPHSHGLVYRSTLHLQGLKCHTTSIALVIYDLNFQNTLIIHY